jgi:hypothetical protein
MWGARGPFLLVAAMVVAVVMPVVFCAKATKKCKKNPKISCLLVVCSIYYQQYIVKHITIQVTLIVAWPEPEL